MVVARSARMMVTDAANRLCVPAHPAGIVVAQFRAKSVRLFPMLEIADVA